MAEIVTAKERFDAEELLTAVEKAGAYFEALDETRALHEGRAGYMSPMTKALAHALEVVNDIRAAEREEEFYASFETDDNA